MTHPRIVSIDVVASHGPILFGKDQGLNAARKVQQRLRESNPEQCVWHLDFRRVESLDYKFFTAYFFSVFDEGVAGLPEDVVFIVTCDTEDVDRITRAMCWKVGELEPQPIEKASERARELSRYYVRRDFNIPTGTHTVEYVGTSEPELRAILDLLYEREQATVNEMSVKLGRQNDDLSAQLKTLRERRHVLRLSEEGNPDALYVSIPKLLEKQETS